CNEPRSPLFPYTTLFRSEESMAAVEEHTKKATEGQKLLYSELSDSQKEAVDSMRDKWEDLAETSTSVFDRISDEAEVSFEEMKRSEEHTSELQSRFDLVC